jgi:hypothetical protein
MKFSSIAMLTTLIDKRHMEISALQQWVKLTAERASDRLAPLFRRISSLKPASACRPRWTEYAVGTDGNVQLGDSVVLFRDGMARLGNTMFAYGTPIDDFYFAGGHRARRRIDAPDYLYLTPPDGPERIYRHGFGGWYRVVPLVESPETGTPRWLRNLKRIAWLGGVWLLFRTDYGTLGSVLFYGGLAMWWIRRK